MVNKIVAPLNDTLQAIDLRIPASGNSPEKIPTRLRIVAVTPVLFNILTDEEKLAWDDGPSADQFVSLGTGQSFIWLDSKLPKAEWLVVQNGSGEKFEFISYVSNQY